MKVRAAGAVGLLRGMARGQVHRPLASSTAAIAPSESCEADGPLRLVPLSKRNRSGFLALEPPVALLNA